MSTVTTSAIGIKMGLTSIIHDTNWTFDRVGSRFVANAECLPERDDGIEQVSSRHGADDAATITIQQSDAPGAFKDFGLAFGGVAQLREPRADRSRFRFVQNSLRGGGAHEFEEPHRLPVLTGVKQACRGNARISLRVK